MCVQSVAYYDCVSVLVSMSANSFVAQVPWMLDLLPVWTTAVLSRVVVVGEKRHFHSSHLISIPYAREDLIPDANKLWILCNIIFVYRT